MKMKNMKNLACLGLLALAPVTAMAAGDAGIKLEPMEVRLQDTRSLQNGAKIFVNYCLSCHSANFMRYERMAKDLDIPEELVLQEMISSDAKIGDPMTSVMPPEKAAEWFGGVAPPDLSLVGRLRGADWLYNYLKGFYVDETTFSGWNNVVFDNVAMPHVMAHWQGRQRAVFGDDEHGNPIFEHFKQETEGSMSPEEFDHAMQDLTNFLIYMGEPARLVRVKYGMWVMLFLFVFGALAYLMKREYWRDVDVSH